MWPLKRRPSPFAKRSYQLLERPLRHYNDDPQYSDKIKQFNEELLGVDGIVYVQFSNLGGFSASYDRDVLTLEQFETIIDKHLLSLLDEGFFPFLADRVTVNPKQLYRHSRRDRFRPRPLDCF